MGDIELNYHLLKDVPQIITYIPSNEKIQKFLNRVRKITKIKNSIFLQKVENYEK